MSDDQKTLFDLPTSPEDFSVLLPPSELRKIDFSALEFATARRALVEYIKTYFPDDFNDFVSNNGVIMLLELLSYTTGVLSLRSDLLANEGFLPTAQSTDAVINHLALISQSVQRATPAITDVECSLATPSDSDVRIPSGLQFGIAGDDGTQITYEIFKSPTDLTGNIVIPAGKRSVIAYGVEGRTDETVVTSDGTENQNIIINTGENVIEQPVRVEVALGDIIEEWNRIDSIERASGDEKVFEPRFFDNRIEFIFGNDVTGAIPPAGADITCIYRLGGGSRGRIGVGAINEQRPVTPEFPFTAPVPVTFRNVTPSSGGVDQENLAQAKRRAPRAFATHNSIITESDYTQIVGDFNHPIFGAVAKAVATIRTGLNANRVELYVLAEGVDGPVAPNEGLKRAIGSYVDEINTLTDHAVVLAGKINAVDLDITVAMSKHADASVIKEKVEDAINDFFDIKNWDMGEPLYISQLYDLLTAIDGVKYIDIFEPSDNILTTGQVNSTEIGVDINELITLGNKEIRYYYESRS